MTARYREGLPRLSIPPPFNIQQPLVFDALPSMFSPATLQNNLHLPFPVSMQTPMQAFFVPQPPLAPGRPTHRGRASSTLVRPQSGIPITPMGQVCAHHPSMSTAGAPGFGQQLLPYRNKRQASIGGPPKAALGGPERKISPLPAVSSTLPTAINFKGKKVTVNLPKETIPGQDEMPATHASWARLPLQPCFYPREQDIIYPELTSADPFPPDSWTYHITASVDVFLPGKNAWNTIKRQLIEEKLEKLGVERGLGSSVAHIHAPRARAASISSPADPALLFFKLNRLQQAQTVSSLCSEATSPQPPFALSPPPNQPPPRFQTRHSHSMSLVQPPSLQPSLGHALAALNPFGPNATLGSDQILHHAARSPISTSVPAESIHAPQGPAPLFFSSLAPPLSAGRTDKHPNFALGFGLDIPEEEEPQEHTILHKVAQEAGMEFDVHNVNGSEGEEPELEVDDADQIEGRDSTTTAPQSRFHSRHASRLSATLSLRSVGGLTEELKEGDMVLLRSPIPNPDIDDLDQEAVGEWTGSDDLNIDNLETSEEESIGEWSNPSDEERARRRRVERRMRRRTQETEIPRRLPNFPCPPNNTVACPLRRNQDIISNPSEDEHLVVEPPGAHYLERSSNMGAIPPRPLPPLPGQISAHDPSNAHSRTTSNHLEGRSSMNRRNSLNPFAKPFVFGALRESESTAYHSPKIVQAPTPFVHSRMPSLGKPLNAAAQEFKPNGFTFRPPPGVPQLTFPAETTRSLPLPCPPVLSPVRAQQGREKRQRRASNSSFGGEDNMNSFKFPNLSDGAHHSEPPSPRTDGSCRQSSLNAPVPPFTFGNFPLLPSGPPESAPLPFPLESNLTNSDEVIQGNNVEVENGDSIARTDDLVVPSVVKTKRAPIPLDFKHSTSSNTIPAGVFKALVNAGDEKTRRSVRSHLSSRETIEHVHLPSLDDLTVPPISRNISRNHLVTDPGEREPPQEADAIFGSRIKRRSSLPPALHVVTDSSPSGISIPAMDLTGKFESQRHEQELEILLEEKMQVIRREIMQNREVMIAELVSLFRAQLEESASHGLEDDRMDARRKLDLALIKDIVQQSQTESQALLRHELDNIVEHLADLDGRTLHHDITSFIDQVKNDVSGAITRFSDYIGSIGHGEPTLERDTLASELLSALTPVLASLRSEPVDYEYLTAQLTQAVKPHISQLIDLASDKRETASLIVDRIVPLLPPSTLSTDTIIGQLTSEIRRIIALIDPFEMKEQVADLVVERLDSRLSLRDRTFNVDTIAGKVNENIGRVLEPLQHITGTLKALAEGERDFSTRHHDLFSTHKDALAIITDLPLKLAAATTTLSAAEADLLSRIETIITPLQPEEAILHIKATLGDLASSQKTLLLRHDELLTTHKDIIDRLDALPESFVAATSVLQVASAAWTSSDATSKRDAENLRNLNADYQIQLSEFQSAHSQIRIEKDFLVERLAEVESDRDKLRVQIKEMEVAATTQSSEVTALQVKAFELEEALRRGLERLKADDVVAQVNQERIDDLEKTNLERTTEKHCLQSKVDSLELQVEFANRNKEAADRSLVVLRKQYDHLSSQQPHWSDLRHAVEKIDLLATLVGQSDSEESKDLRHIRDRCIVLESEHARLQKLTKDQEAKVANHEKAAGIAQHSLSQVQQRAAEWEARAKEHEVQLEMIQTKLDQAEQTRAQLDIDYALVLEEREVDIRLMKDRENKLREQLMSLESEVARLQGELEQMNKVPVTLNGPGARFRHSNGNSYSRSGTPVLQANGKISKTKSTSPSASVWDSMHAPISRAVIGGNYPNHISTTPKAHFSVSHRPSIPSPTPSTVSLAPTQGSDGWWA